RSDRDWSSDVCSSDLFAGEVSRRDRALEALEDPILGLGGDADAAILHRDDDAIVLAADGDRDGLPPAVLQGIGDEVGEDLIEAEIGRASCREREKMRV